MRIAHPETDQTADVAEESYELVYRFRGWLPAEDADLPLPDFSDMTIAQVLTYLDANPTRTAEVLAAEQDGRARKTLIAELEERRDALPALAEPADDAAAPTDPADEADTTTTSEENS